MLALGQCCEPASWRRALNGGRRAGHGSGARPPSNAERIRFSVDLIVMGGYAHARLRSLALGGVTRAMLDSMTVPVLMSH